MNRNMIESVKKVFNKLREFADFADKYKIISGEEEEEWLKRLEIKDLSNELQIKDNKIRLFPDWTLDKCYR